MTYLLLLVFIHLGLAAVTLSGLWGQSEWKREFWTGAALLVVSLGFAMMVSAEYRPPSAWKLIEAVFGPIGTPLFKPKAG